MAYWASKPIRVLCVRLLLEEMKDRKMEDRKMFLPGDQRMQKSCSRLSMQPKNCNAEIAENAEKRVRRRWEFSLHCNPSNSFHRAKNFSGRR